MFEIIWIYILILPFHLLNFFFFEMLPDIRYCSFLKVMAFKYEGKHTRFFKIAHNVMVKNTQTAPMLKTF